MLSYRKYWAPKISEIRIIRLCNNGRSRGCRILLVTDTGVYKCLPGRLSARHDWIPAYDDNAGSHVSGAPKSPCTNPSTSSSSNPVTSWDSAAFFALWRIRGHLRPGSIAKDTCSRQSRRWRNDALPTANSALYSWIVTLARAPHAPRCFSPTAMLRDAYFDSRGMVKAWACGRGLALLSDHEYEGGPATPLATATTRVDSATVQDFSGLCTYTPYKIRVWEWVQKKSSKLRKLGCEMTFSRSYLYLIVPYRICSSVSSRGCKITTPCSQMRTEERESYFRKSLQLRVQVFEVSSFFEIDFREISPPQKVRIFALLNVLITRLCFSFSFRFPTLTHTCSHVHSQFCRRESHTRIIITRPSPLGVRGLFPE